MASVTVSHVTKSFGNFPALSDISIDFSDGGLYSLLGPSGSGKTTLLRLIAGFSFPNTGEIHIGGSAVERLPVEKRNIGMMFQNYALFPNMSVYDNVAFGLMVRDTNKEEISKRVGDVLELVRLTGYDRRKPHELSGGQRQRVALARAIIFRPKVLLLDEPLSALDKALRLGMQVELKRIQREIGVTTILVTHDQEEALTLSDKVGVLKDGKLLQEGTPREIYERPATAFAASFLGDANLFKGRVVSGALELDGGSCLRSLDVLPEGGTATCAVRPEKISIVADDEVLASDANVMEARLDDIVFAGNSLNYLLHYGDIPLQVFAQNHEAAELVPGQLVKLAWYARDTILVEA
ncbi:ABC transporter ATP-binding protein [Halomonas salipaludis]|uniref:Spermidine/putrescine ABC transporter ATP-binding protein n=1 Tax=Halomonas salipaludis TaxID=2032625 RepID=A0A2A2ER91_9GAMM|nr:ABC transporter ATP-binding protein [Halomonas salipaludis]PAU75168.1 spermidine/putrescine ABC transporter ATP-binding protein [Halomonas salipaludis]